VAIGYFAGGRRPASHHAQRPNVPHCDCRRALLPPPKSGNSSPLAEGRKEEICTTTRTLKGVTFPADSSLRKTAGTPEKKKIS
jgi:hypothetical protein